MVVDPHSGEGKQKLFFNESFSTVEDYGLQFGDVRIATSLDGIHSMKTIIVDFGDIDQVHVCAIHTSPEFQTDRDIRIDLVDSGVFSSIFLQKDVNFYVWKHQLGSLIASISEEQIHQSAHNVGVPVYDITEARYLFKQEQMCIAHNITQHCAARMLQSMKSKLQDETNQEIDFHDGE